MYTVQVHEALKPLMGDIRCPHAKHLVAEIATEVIELLSGDRYDVASGHHSIDRDSLVKLISDHLADYSPAGAAINPGRLHED